VNDFLVVLQKSNFFNADQTKIVTSERQPETALTTTALPGPDGQSNGASNNAIKPGDLPKLPAKVTFKIGAERCRWFGIAD
jgi:hypothetical protein